MNHTETNWDEYYQKTAITAHYSRMILKNRLSRILRHEVLPGINKKEISVLELGGGNSCVFHLVTNILKPVRYCVADKCKKSLDMLLQKSETAALKPQLIQADILSPMPELHEQFDVVFSIGLIEHFSPEETKKVIQYHIDYTKPGGFTILFFPTPTFLYCITRYIAEKLNVWIFHDERPLKYSEVEQTIYELPVRMQESGILYFMFLTQQYVVLKKEG